MRDCAFDVDGLRLAGLTAGPEDGTPVLMLHGWMDHAGSFSELAPRLEGCRCVALDLSGQGLSDHRAAHATYNIWDDLPQIAGVLDRLGWADCVVVGHSRGAIIGALMAAAMPDRVRALVALDALVPEPTDKSAALTLRAFVEQTKKQMARDSRTFATLGEYVARRAAQGNSESVALALADRALEAVDGGYRLRADPRLFASSAMKLDQTDAEDVMRAIACPVLNLWGTEGILRQRPTLQDLAKLAPRLIARYEAEEIAGDHHFHMDAVGADHAALHIAAFLRRHGVG